MQRLLNYFHREAPVDALCVYRICLGLMLFYESSTWLPYTTELFSNIAFHLPNLAGVPAPSPQLAFFLCLILLFSTLMVAAGLFTRYAILTTLAVWTYFYSLDGINEKSDQTIAIVMLTILAFSSCANRYSLDHWLRKRLGRAAAPATASVFAQRLIQIEVAQVYFFCGVVKMMDPDWVSGTTFYSILNCEWASDLGIYISSMNPDLIARVGGLGTILYELFAGFLLFVPPLRPFIIPIGICFHLGIQATLKIGTLGFHFIFPLLLLFLEPETVAKQVQILRRKLAHTLQP